MNTEIKPPSGFRLFPGIWIIAGVLALIGARYAWCWSQYPHQIKQFAKELSSTIVIQKAPVVNHAGNLVGLIHTTQEGMGIFIADTATKSEQKLIEVKDVDYAPSGAWTFGWSPDDKTFAFSLTNLFFWNGSGDAMLDEVMVPNGIEPFAWLSPTVCAYIDRSPHLVLVEFVNGHWQQTQSFPLSAGNGKPRSLLATGTNSVAWQTDNALWQMDISPGAGGPKEIYSGSPKTIKSISYAKATCTFLLVENTPHTATSSLRTVANNDVPSAATLLSRPSITDAQWINNGAGFVYEWINGDSTILTVKKNEESPEINLFKNGHAWSFFCDGDDDRIYSLASQKSEPAGVWKFNGNPDDMVCAIPPWEGGKDINFHFQPALVGAARFELGGHTHYAKFDLVPPANFSRQKKYPLVIGTASYEWTPIPHGIYAQCLAKSGAYVALVNYTWNQSQPDTVHALTNNILAVYNQLIANPNIDSTRVFLFGFSAGTVVMSDLVREYPGRWRGLMLLNPSWLPEPVPGMTGRVLATAGSGEGEGERFRLYQKSLFQVGIAMDWHIHANAQHVVRDQNAMYERTIYMGELIFK